MDKGLSLRGEVPGLDFRKGPRGSGRALAPASTDLRPHPALPP